MVKRLQLGKGGNLKNKVSTLVEWGLGKSDVEKILTIKSSFTGLAQSTLLKKLEFLIENFDFERKDVLKVVKKYPTFLTLSMEGNVQPHLNSFRGDASKLEVKRMILRFPNVVGYGKKYATLEKFFSEAVGLSAKDFRGVVLRFPAVLGYSIETNLKPKLDRFRNFGFTNAELAKQFTECPSLLGRDFDKTIKAKMEWLEQSFGFQEREVLNELKWAPAKFVNSLATWENAHAFLKSMDMTHGDIQELLRNHFKILSTKRDLLEENAEFARSVLKKSNQDIISCPEYLTAPLYRVVLCRIGILQHFGESPQELPLASFFGYLFTEKTKEYDQQELDTFVEKFHSIPMESRIGFVRDKMR